MLALLRNPLTWFRVIGSCSPRARDRIGRYAFVAYVAVLMALYVGDRFGGPPPSMTVVAWVGGAAAVAFVPWAWWFDHHRASRGECVVRP